MLPPGDRRSFTESSWSLDVSWRAAPSTRRTRLSWTVTSLTGMWSSRSSFRSSAPTSGVWSSSRGGIIISPVSKAEGGARVHAHVAARDACARTGRTETQAAASYRWNSNWLSACNCFCISRVKRTPHHPPRLARSLSDCVRIKKKKKKQMGPCYWTAVG